MSDEPQKRSPEKPLSIGLILAALFVTLALTSWPTIFRIIFTLP